MLKLLYPQSEYAKEHYVSVPEQGEGKLIPEGMGIQA